METTTAPFRLAITFRNCPSLYSSQIQIDSTNDGITLNSSVGQLKSAIKAKVRDAGCHWSERSMRLEAAQANTARSLGTDDTTLSTAGLRSGSSIICALPSINRTAILAGASMAACTYLVFHPDSMFVADISSSSSSPSGSSSTSTSTTTTPLSSALHHQQVKTQIFFCVLAHTFVNRRVESAISFAISWILWASVHYFYSSSQSLAFSIAQNGLWWRNFTFVAGTCDSADCTPIISPGQDADKWSYFIEIGIYFAAASVYTVVFALFQWLLWIPFSQFTRPRSLAPTSIADSLQSAANPSLRFLPNTAQISSAARSWSPDQITSFLIMCTCFVMIVHNHHLWDTYPQIPFIVTIIQCYFVATASTSMPLHYVLVLSAIVSSHIISTSVVTAVVVFVSFSSLPQALLVFVVVAVGFWLLQQLIRNAPTNGLTARQFNVFWPIVIAFLLVFAIWLMSSIGTVIIKALPKVFAVCVALVVHERYRPIRTGSRSISSRYSFLIPPNTLAEPFLLLNPAKRPLLSVVVPLCDDASAHGAQAFNALLNQLLQTLRSQANTHFKFTWEMILVDDFSSDATLQLTEKWCREQAESGSCIKLLSLPRTKGAVKEGMLRACGEHVCVAPLSCALDLRLLLHHIQGNTLQYVAVVGKKTYTFQQRAHWRARSVSLRSAAFEFLEWIFFTKLCRSHGGFFSSRVVLLDRATAVTIAPKLNTMQTCMASVEIQYLARMNSVMCLETPYDPHADAALLIERNEHGQVMPQSSAAQVVLMLWLGTRICMLYAAGVWVAR